MSAEHNCWWTADSTTHSFVNSPPPSSAPSPLTSPAPCSRHPLSPHTLSPLPPFPNMYPPFTTHLHHVCGQPLSPHILSPLPPFPNMYPPSQPSCTMFAGSLSRHTPCPPSPHSRTLPPPPPTHNPPAPCLQAASPSCMCQSSPVRQSCPAQAHHWSQPGQPPSSSWHPSQPTPWQTLWVCWRWWLEGGAGARETHNSRQ